MKIKIKASALMISMILGIVLSGILVGIVVAMSQHIKTSGQTRDDKIAYRAAVSGIEDGLLRYKYAYASNKESNAFRDATDFPTEYIVTNSSPTALKASYQLTIKMDSLTIGDNFASWWNSFNPNPGTSNYDNQPQPFLVDDTVDINLSYLLKEKGLQSIELQFSSPYQKSASANTYNPISGYFSAVNYQLVDVRQTGEAQVVDNYTNTDSSNHTRVISNFSGCLGSTHECHLKIKPQVAKNYTASAYTSAGRLLGQGAPSAGKYIFFKIKALDSGNQLIPDNGNKPGVITIESIGIAGEAKHRLEARVDASTGKYLGLFDYGAYCGDKCSVPSSYATSTAQ
jgi:hypothetical protein